MLVNDFYSRENIGPYEFFDVGEFQLEEGGVIPNLQLAYVTHGELNADKSNAILMINAHTLLTSVMSEGVFF